MQYIYEQYESICKQTERAITPYHIAHHAAAKLNNSKNIITEYTLHIYRLATCVRFSDVAMRKDTLKKEKF